MRRMDVAIAVGLGLLLVLSVLAITLLSIDPLAPLVAALGRTSDWWYLGPAAAVAAFLLGRIPAWRSLSRGLGIVGIAWITFVVGFALLLTAIFALVGPVGP